MPTSAADVAAAAAAAATAPTATFVVTTMRPNTLNVCRDKTDNDTNKFIREALHAWRAKARCSVVPAERLRDLFEELHFSPTEKQINEMLQTAKLFARRGSSLEANVSGVNSKRVNGLTFGEFCVLAADLKRFRTTAAQPPQYSHNHEHSHQQQQQHQHQHQQHNGRDAQTSAAESDTNNGGSRRRSSSSTRSNEQLQPSAISSAAAALAPLCQHANVADDSEPVATAPEVFLGGSCNPTTWRADVAIPALDRLGISFYNPQVSDWTPDLIELEHRAKEKARVLFFVMDSETRASAGAIEAAHIAGQNARHLVLVLHPYKPQQCILNEPLSAQEFLDLKRNQQLLRELVTRRGLPVLDNIPSGLLRTRAILAGTSERPTPHNIASRLISVSRAFDLVANASSQAGRITIAQCQCALPLLGFAHNLLSTDNLHHILCSHRDAVEALESAAAVQNGTNASAVRKTSNAAASSVDATVVSFDEFCMLTSYLTVLQQEIHENGCVSPIKGTNLPPPPIYLTNQLEFTQHQPTEAAPTVASSSVGGAQIFRTSSCRSVPYDGRHNNAASKAVERQDSGTSSPVPSSSKSSSSSSVTGKQRDQHQQQLQQHPMEHRLQESDSTDSVFSASESTVVHLRDKSPSTSRSAAASADIRDVYLGGSCALRTRWREEVAVPLLEQRGLSYNLPMLHESIDAMAAALVLDDATTVAAQLPYLRGSRGSAKVEESDDGLVFDPSVLEASRVLMFVITNETRSLAPMTLAAHYIGLGYNVVLCIQMLPEFCIIGSEKLTPLAIKDYNRGRSYLADLAKRQGVPIFADLRAALDCATDKVRTCNSRNSI